MLKTHKLTKVLDEVDEIILQGLQEQAFPGAALWIRWQGETVRYKTYGKTSHETYSVYKPALVTKTTLYDLASLTKIVATTYSIMHLVEQGFLNLDDPIANYVPQFGVDKQKNTVTIKHLLTHTSGLPGPLNLYQECHGESQMINGISQLKLMSSPGTRYLYSDWGFILLGEAVRVISSLRLDAYAQVHIFEPLNMKNTMFLPSQALKYRLAPTEFVEWRGGLVHGEVHDENAWAMGGVAGHAGLFSTIEDLTQFCTMVLKRGEYGSERVLNATSVVNMETVYKPDPDESRGLGWVINAPYFMGNLASWDTIGHTGFTGTSIIMNRTQDLALVFLTNRVCPSRKGPVLNPYRQRIANAVAKLSKI